MKKPSKTAAELEASIRVEMEQISDLPTDLASGRKLGGLFPAKRNGPSGATGSVLCSSGGNVGDMPPGRAFAIDPAAIVQSYCAGPIVHSTFWGIKGQRRALKCCAFSGGRE